MRRALKWLGWILGGLVILTLALVAIVAVGANLQSGRNLIESLTPKLTGDMVRIAGLSGRFPDRLRARRIEVRDSKGTYLTIETLALDWHPLRLIQGVAAIESLTAEHVDVARLPVYEAATSGGTSSASSFSLPVSVELDALHVSRLEVEPAVAGAGAVLEASGSARLASLEQGTARLALRRLDGEGSYDLTAAVDPDHLKAQLKATEPAHGLLSSLAQLPELGPLSIDAGLDGPQSAVGTKLSIEAGPLRARADGTVDLVHQAADLAVTASAPAMSPRPDISWQSVALNARVQGPFTRPEANGTLNIETLKAAGAAIGKLAAQLQGNAGRVQLHAEATGIQVPGPKPALLAGSPLTVDAAVQLDAPERPATFAIKHQLLDLEGTAQTGGALRADANLSLPDLAPLAAAGGVDVRGHATLKLDATQQPDGTLTATVAGPVAITGGMAPLPGLIGDAGTVAVTAAMKGQDITLSRLEVNGKTLTLSADGSMRDKVIDLNWKTGLSNLAVVSPTLTGRVAAQGHVEGPQDDLSIAATLNGDLATRGMPSGPIEARLEARHVPKAPEGKLTAQGTLEGAPLNLDVGLQQEASGAMHVVIERASWKSAQANGALDLPKGAVVPIGKLDLRVARLDDFRPLVGQPLSGSVTASLETLEQNGRQTARLRAEAKGAGLTGSASINRATLTATVADPTSKPVVDAKLVIDGASAGGMTANANLDVNGPQDALKLRLAGNVQNLQGAPLKLDTGATLDAPGQRVTVNNLTAAWKGQTLRLAAPARIEFGDTLSVDRLRLALGQATMEVAGRVSPTLDLTAAIRNVTPDLAKIVDPSINAEGSLQADARLTGTTARPVGTVRAEARGLRMRTGPGQGLPPANLTAAADLNGDTARIDARLTAGKLTTLTVTGRAPVKPSAGTMDLRANGSMDLALLNPILTAGGRRVRGQVTLDATATGPLSGPRVNGTAQLSNGEVQDFPQGLRLEGMSALIEAQGDTIRITRFAARAGPGTINLSGTVGVSAPGMPVHLLLVANRARPLSSDRLTVDLNANLTVDGEAKTRLGVAGGVQILRAEIRIPEHMPPNIAVLNVRNLGEPPPPPPAPGPDIGLNLTLSAQREIFVRGRGIFAELGGTMRVQGTAANPQPLGGFQLIRGTISVAGQSLDFSKGDVSFNGGKLTDPSIDFIATSTNGSITANLQVTGTVSNPQIKLFSTPELPQDEVLAQLIFKRSTSALSPFEIAEMAAALASLTGAPTGLSDPLEKVRKELGLDTLSIGGGTGNSGPTLQAGRYVAPGVFVGAKQGTGGTSTQGLVQIDITKGLKLEGTVGTGTNTNPGAKPEDSAGSSLGLKYQFEY